MRYIQQDAPKKPEKEGTPVIKPGAKKDYDYSTLANSKKIPTKDGYK